MKLNSKTRKMSKTNYFNQKGITVIALVITIVVLLILAGVSINAIFSENGIINKAKDVQKKMNEAQQKDLDVINVLSNWMNSKTNGTTGGNDNPPTTTPKISTLVETAVTENTKAEDAYGNKIIIPKGFKVLAPCENATTGDVTYSYSGDNIPAVQDGIVIEDTQEGTAGNQFVWVPVGTINNKSDDLKGVTSTITLGRYEFDRSTGDLKSNIPVQNVENYTQRITINTYFEELTTFREGNKSDGSENATARDLKTFIETSLANGGYYIARFEASGDSSKIYSKYNQTVLTNITQPNAAKAAREMYGDTTEYASDLANSYAWDTAIIFIQTYSGKTDYAGHNESETTGSFTATGKNNDKYCNIWDMSGNASEWTTEYSTQSSLSPCVTRGGYYATADDRDSYYTSYRLSYGMSNSSSGSDLRPILYVK